MEAPESPAKRRPGSGFYRDATASGDAGGQGAIGNNSANSATSRSTIEIRGGKKVRILWYADCGVTTVSNGIIVHTDLLKENPGLVRTFVAASLKGLLWGRNNPDEAAAIVKKFAETVNPAIARREMELSWNTWVTPNTRGKPLGWMSDKDWEETVRNLRDYGGVTTPLDPRVLYTNEFVPTGDEFIPPQP